MHASPTAHLAPPCRLRQHDVPRLGPVLEVVLSGRRDPDFWQEVREVLRQEIPRRSPRYLVFDLRGLDCIVGSAFLGGLVAGVVQMKRLGMVGVTRVVATGEMGRQLTGNIALCKLEPILGRVHSDVSSAILELVRQA